MRSRVESRPRRRPAAPDRGTDRARRPHAQPRERRDQLLAVKGRWLGDDTFEIVSQSVTEGIVTTASVTFRGREVDVTYAANTGFSTRQHGQRAD